MLNNKINVKKNIRKNIVSVAFTDDELVIFKERVENTGLSNSDYIRKLIFEHTSDDYSLSMLINNIFSDKGKKLIGKALKNSNKE